MILYSEDFNTIEDVIKEFIMISEKHVAEIKDEKDVELSLVNLYQFSNFQNRFKVNIRNDAPKDVLGGLEHSSLLYEDIFKGTVVKKAILSDFPELSYKQATSIYKAFKDNFSFSYSNGLKQKEFVSTVCQFINDYSKD